MKFRTTVELGGKTATGMAVPTEVVDGLAAGKRPPVTVTIDGFTYRSTIASMGGRFMIPLSAERRNACGLAAGDEVEVEVELDQAPREVAVPADLAAALAAEPVAQDNFARLSFSHRSAHVLAIEGAKSVDTRRRRIDKAVAALLAQP